jgi:molybdate-binding protein/DNA-binding XRE family transcriptional regulator
MKSSTPELVCRVREARLAAGMSQQALAAQVGLSRQALSSLEAGRAIPGTDVALRLAQALQCQVEALFTQASGPARVKARLATDAAVMPKHRVLLSADGGDRGEWVAWALEGRRSDGLQAADGVVTQARGSALEVELLGTPQAIRERLVVMGCAPALGLLAARLGAGPRRVAMSWVYGTSGESLDALERGDVHLAGIHLRDAHSGRYNVPQVQRRFAARPMLIVNFASWEQGLVVAKGNPLRLRAVEDVLRPRVRLVRREPGAGANKLLEQLLKPAGAPERRPPALVAHGHLEVAQAIAHGAADVGVAIGSVALAWGLDFIPLSSERFDLVFPQAMATDPRVERLIDELSSPSFRRELDSLGGYETRESGHVIRPTSKAR